MRAGFKSIDGQLVKLQQDVRAIRDQTATNSEAIAEINARPVPSA
jgi:predicted  nucleic acid-binding Zn-ribbon protein